MAKQKLTTKKKVLTTDEKRQRLEKQHTEWDGSEYTIKYAWLRFMVTQQNKGNSKATLDYYRRFYKKLVIYLNQLTKDKVSGEETPVDWLTHPLSQTVFMHSLGDVNQQTINSYLRAYRAFGNFCEEEGLIEGFKCPIKEVEPPAKQVYTDKELKRLLKKPDINDFEEYRNFIIISLILSTGARCNTILNIQIKDVELEEGYITFNTTKAHKIVRIGLERKIRRDLTEYITRWRSFIFFENGEDEAIPNTDYLFCNTYGEQLTRGGLSKAIANYNKRRGVEKTSIHLLRHTFAKNWITSGGDIISLAKVLTHSELEMVKRYSNLYGEDVKEEIEQHSTLSQLRQTSGKTLKTSNRKPLKKL